METKYLSLMIAGLLTIVATGCIVSVEPERATNPVGTEHTVTITLRDPMDIDIEAICEALKEALEEESEEVPPGPYCNVDVNTQAEDDAVGFFIQVGPNAGISSVAGDGICTPSCAELAPEISWTYQSNGVPGVDIINACVNPALLFPPTLSTQQLTQDEFYAILVDVINDVLGTDYESIQDPFCQSVTKTWEVPQERPNIGAGLSGLFAGQPTPLPTAPVAPSQTIRPPSTGDGGLW
jgi:hypothetical protein